MANSSSARKRIRSIARKHERNRRVRSSVRTVVAKVRRAIESPSEAGPGELVRAAVSALDRAAEHGIIHPRNAARRKSRLMRQAHLAALAGEERVTVAKSRPAARGTRPKAAAARKPAAAKTRRSATKTERTAASQRRAAGKDAAGA